MHDPVAVVLTLLRSFPIYRARRSCPTTLTCTSIWGPPGVRGWSSRSFVRSLVFNVHRAHTVSLSLLTAAGLILCHPEDFTPVCTTELGEAAKRESQLLERGVKTVGFSCNDADMHRKWISDIEALTGGCVQFPIFCDRDRSNAVRLGILDERFRDQQYLPRPFRSVYILDPNKLILLTMTYPATTGRNFDEIIRVIDSLQLTVNMRVATPVNWAPGKDVIVDHPLTDEQAADIFGKSGFQIQEAPSERGRELPRHYMRWTKDPCEFPPEGN